VKKSFMAESKCRHCGSANTYGISRVVGYFSKIEDWNNSKKAEFEHRQKGNYSVKEEEAEAGKAAISAVKKEPAEKAVIGAIN